MFPTTHHHRHRHHHKRVHRAQEIATSTTTTTSHIQLVCTNDLHSHCHRYEELTRVVKERTGSAAAWMWVDAGDWFSGTVYASLGPNKMLPDIAPEVEFFHSNNVVAALGNHEWDAQTEGLLVMLEKARRMGYHQFVSTDLEYDMQHDNGKRMATLISDDFTHPNVVNRAVLYHVTKEIRVGVVAFMGKDARRGCAATTQGGGLSFASWRASKKRGREMVARLRAAGAQLILALVHGGLHEAMEMKDSVGADFAVSGHTHESIVPSASTPVIQAQSYGTAFGLCELDPYATSANVLVSATIVPVPHTSPCHHPCYLDCLVPWFKTSLQMDLTTPIPLSHTLPRAATSPLTRKEHDPFATWACTVIKNEVNELLSAHLPRVDGFFLANELIRGDLSQCRQAGKTDLPCLMSCFEVGQSRPDKLGVDVVILQTTRAAVKRLWFLLYLACRFYTENAVPAYSEGFFDVDRDVCYVATTKFMIQSLDMLPGFIFDVKQTIHVLESVPLSILIRNGLMRACT